MNLQPAVLPVMCSCAYPNRLDDTRASYLSVSEKFGKSQYGQSSLAAALYRVPHSVQVSPGFLIPLNYNLTYIMLLYYS